MAILGGCRYSYIYKGLSSPFIIGFIYPLYGIPYLQIRVKYKGTTIENRGIMGWLNRELAEATQLPIIKTISHHRDENGRFHRTALGISPGVTTILNRTKEGIKYLDKWREANPELSQSYLERGNLFHSNIEDYFEGITPSSISPLYYQVEGFLEPLIPLAIEYPLHSLSGFAGSPDCLARKGEELLLLDWKTSTKNKSRKQCRDYLLQLAAYDKLIQENLGLSVDRACVFLARESHDTARKFWAGREELDELYKEFIERLNSYNSLFDNVF